MKEGFTIRPDSLCIMAKRKETMNQHGANARSVWTIATQGYKGAHLPSQRCILGERGVCADCGAPWVRVVEKELKPRADAAKRPNPVYDDAANYQGNIVPGIKARITTKPKPSAGNPPAAATPTPYLVLDPFSGNNFGGRSGVGPMECRARLNPDYLQMAKTRIDHTNVERTQLLL